MICSFFFVTVSSDIRLVRMRSVFKRVVVKAGCLADDSGLKVFVLETVYARVVTGGDKEFLALFLSRFDVPASSGSVTISFPYEFLSLTYRKLAALEAGVT